MENYLFKIPELNCSYNQKDIVLKIKDLIIPSKKISILLGISGAGKSTFLETLGLMNNTFYNGNLIFNPNNGSKPINLSKVWNSETYISDIRNRYYSFIFQNTNLMPNFTALENVCITQMIQGLSFEEAKENAKSILGKMGLSEIENNKKVYELSGGQQQRLAFVRAITPVYSVLFGDEPTGNLDEYNSEELMKIIREQIMESNKSAIIVSHNINLALKYADFIMIIDKPKGMKYGEINRSTVFSSSVNENGSIEWFDSSNRPVNEIKELIQEKLFSNN
jgi:ABC-type lipoprotein export system ATPase subunit